MKVALNTIEQTKHNEKQNKKYHTVGKFQKSNWGIIERDKIYIPKTQIHDCSLSWIGTSISIQSGGVKLVILAQTLNTHFRITKSSTNFHLIPIPDPVVWSVRGTVPTP